MLHFARTAFGGAGFMLALLGVAFVAPLSAQDPIPMDPVDPILAEPVEPIEPAGAGVPETRSVLVDTVFVQGNERVTEVAVRQIAGLRSGARVSGMDIQDAIRRLMATGNFETVEIFSDRAPGGAAANGVQLTIEVRERPLISQVEFRGLTRVSARTVRDTVGIRDNQPLNPAKVVETEYMIRNLLARAGFQVESIDTTMVPVTQPEGAYRLTYNVVEGPRLTVSQIEFRGNEAFSGSDLSAAMRTRPEGFWWFRTGRYDREALEEDLWDRLPQHYGAHGYIDFAVVSDTMIVDPETGHARLVIEVEEGPQYILGEFDVEGNSRFPTEQLTQIFTAQRRSVLGLPFLRSGQRERGEVFDRSALDAATSRVSQLYRNEGFLYSEVEPVLERVPPTGADQPHTVNVTWSVIERMPFHVRDVRIAGNTFTHESVIRDQVFVLPGDVYNEERLIQSYQSISALGFFETPLALPDIQPDLETGEVDIVFEVAEKQTGSINFGTMFGGQRGGGVSGFVGYTQPNLFGQAKAADVRAEYGWGRNSFQATYTDPALFGTRNSGTASLFHMGDRYFNFADGRRIQTGASLRYGMPVPWLFRTRAFIGYSLSSTRYQAVDQDCAEGDILSIFCLPTATASNLSLGVTRDTRNHPLFPTVGTRQTVNLGHTGGPLGGDGNFRKLTTDFDWWVPAATFGGAQGGIGGIRTAIGLQARAGGIFGDAGLFPFERFFMGGTQFGQQLRGYEETEITPLGYIARNDPRFSGQSAARLGDAFLLLTAEYAIRFTDNISVSVFGDAGNVWNRAAEVDPSRLFRSAGLGITLVTPFGPLGLDYAYGFDGDPPGWQFHFKLGQGGF
jgi:outer membrane protein insertion porin family